MAHAARMCAKTDLLVRVSVLSVGMHRSVIDTYTSVKNAFCRSGILPDRIFLLILQPESRSSRVFKHNLL